MKYTIVAYKIHIAGVDAAFYWESAGTSPEHLISFLQRFDHEGSTVTLDLYDRLGGSPIHTITDYDELYAVLQHAAVSYVVTYEVPEAH